jgi:phosphate-selective porin OprO/OprP
LKRFNPCFAACAAALACLLAGTATATGGGDKSVNEKILDILLQEGTIDQKRYDLLMEEAQEEKRSASLPPVGATKDGPTDWKAYWKDGARIERNDGLYKIKFGGRIQYDMAASSVSGRLQNLFPDAEGTGNDFRRARLFTQGVFGERGIFKAQYDFAGSDADFKDVYAGLRKIPLVGTVRAGHFYEPQSLEMTTSSKYTTFLERSLPVLAFTAERNAGVGFHNQFFDERMTFHAGGFRDVGDDGEEFDNQGNYNAGFRVSGLPIWEDEGDKVVHTGIWYSRKFGRDETVMFDPDAESNTVGSLLDMPAIPTDGIHLLGTEVAGVFGPLSLQSEFIAAFVDGDGTPDRTFYGNYITASYFLTGERRKYDRKLGVFGRTKPKESFSLAEGSWGGFEVAGRWSYLTLNDGSVRGGILNDFTLALNWYLYSNLRLMANWVHANRNGIGEANIFQTRVSLDF